MVGDLPIPVAAIDPAALDGKIYVFGGKMTEIISSDNILIFDPVMGSWAFAGKLVDSLEAIAVEVINGKFYLIGGHSHPDFVYRREIITYDPISQDFDTVGYLPTPKAWYTTAVVDGNIYVIGGDDKVQSIQTVDIFDSMHKTWTVGPPLHTARAGLSADTLGGKIYVTGGGAGTTAFNTVEIFDPLTPSAGWTYGTATLNIERAFHVAKNIGGRLYVIGGAKGFANPFLSSVEFLNEVSGNWEPHASLNFARRELGVAVLHDSIAYAIGGASGNFGAGTYLKKVEKTSVSVSSHEADGTEARNPTLRVSPNPFSEKTTIFYQIAEADKIQVTLYDPLGRLIRTLAPEWHNAGEYAIDLDRNNLMEGIYTCVLRTGKGAESRTRMVVQ